MRLLLVDPSPVFRVALRQRLACAFPAIEVSEYDPDQQGAPSAAFDWRLYDLVLLSQELGGAGSGLDWLRRYAARPGFPPTVLIAGHGDEYLAVAACKAGARGYLRRVDALGARLAELVQAECRRTPFESTQLLADVDPAEPATRAARMPDLRERGYRLLRLIGHGGFSRVYLAERMAGGPRVVVKVTDIAQGRRTGALQRFLREAALLEDIDHPHVVRVFEHGSQQGCAWLAMEFFPGGDLRRRLETGLELDQAVRYLRDVAQGLRAIHARGIVHRDLKPGNLMFRADGTLTLADFGIARRLGEDSDLTTRFGLVGTPSYLSPEQAHGAHADARSDLYSLGVVFYELLTGRKPFAGDGVEAVLSQHVSAPLPRLPQACAAAQPLLDLLLAKAADERLQSAGELLELIDAWLPRGLGARGVTVRLAA